MKRKLSNLRLLAASRRSGVGLGTASDGGAHHRSVDKSQCPDFTALPQDFVLAILENWLSICPWEIARLDVAFCNHSMRASILTLLATVRVNEEHPLAILKQITHISEYATWIAARSIRINKMILKYPCQRICSPPLPGIRELYIDDVPSEHSLEDESTFLANMMLFPSVTRFDCHRACCCLYNFGNVLAKLPWKLTSLDANNCCWYGGMLSVVTSAIGSELEELKADVTNVHVLRNNCRKLRRLMLGCGSPLTINNMVIFCINNPLLEQLTLEPTLFVLTNDAIRQITKRCRLLKSIRLGADYSDPVGVISVICKNCPSIEHIDAGDVSCCFFVRQWDGKKACDLKIQDISRCSSFSNLLDVVPFPIAGLIFVRDGFKNEWFKLVAARCGNDLDTLTIRHLSEDITMECMLSFARVCRNVNHLRLSRRGPEGKSSCYPLTCLAEFRNLQTLQLCPAVFDVTDVGFIAFLKSLSVRRRMRLRAVFLDGCKKLTDESLLAIARYLPDLNTLSVVNTGMKHSTIVNLVKTAQVGAKDIFCADRDGQRVINCREFKHLADR